MEKVYEDFFREMLKHQDNISEYIDSLYDDSEYSADDLNSILGKFKNEKLISCLFADNRAWVHSITFEGKHYFDNKEEPINSMTKQPKIFISHSTKDKEYVAAFVELLSSMGLNQNHIFCSSLPGYDIGMDKDIFEYLREQFEQYNLHVFIIHSKNYYSSPVSLNEMGAAWVLKNSCTSILLPGFNFSEMRGVVNSNNISLKLDNDKLEVQSKLNQIYNSLVDEFALSKLDDILWQQKRDKFIGTINAIVPEIQDSVDETMEVEKRISNEAQSILIEAGKTDDGNIIIISTLSGMAIQAGRTEMNRMGDTRASARMEAALRELETAGLIIQRDSKGELYQITNDGYLYLDNLSQ